MERLRFGSFRFDPSEYKEKKERGAPGLIEKGSQDVNLTQISDADVQECLDYYCAQHEKKYDARPVFRSLVEAKTTLRDVLRKVHPAGKSQVLGMLKVYFLDDRQYYRTRHHPLELLLTDIQSLAAAASAANKKVRVPRSVTKIKTDTRCPRCQDYFDIECSVGDLEKMVLSTLCAKCAD